MATAEFIHGNPLMVDHTPSAAVSAGDVVVVGDVVRIAHNDIEADALGALAAVGGVYDVPCDGATAFAAGVKVYWDATAGAATESDGTGANNPLGWTAAAATAAETTLRVIHDPSA